MLLPANASGYVYRDRVTLIPYKNPPAKTAPITAQVRALAWDAILAALATGPKTIGELSKAAAPCFDAADITQSVPLAYDITDSLHRAGKVRFENYTLEGAAEGLQAPKVRIALV